jgi:hypothetical protein
MYLYINITDFTLVNVKNINYVINIITIYLISLNILFKFIKSIKKKKEGVNKNNFGTNYSIRI